MHESTATELLRRADAGDQDAWNALVDRYTNLLWGVGRAHRLSTVDAADVVQTTWLRLIENMDRIQDPERLPGWLATTARRECLAVLRRAGREPLGSGDDAALDVIDDLAEPLDARLLADERTPRCGAASSSCPTAAGWSCASSWPHRHRPTPTSPRRSACRSAASVRPAAGASSACRGWPTRRPSQRGSNIRKGRDHEFLSHIQPAPG